MISSLTEAVAHESYAVLFENVAAREAFLIKTYGDKIVAKQALSDIDDAEKAERVEMTVKLLMSNDPTPQKRYSHWLVTRWLSGGVRSEDWLRTKQALTLYDEVKRRLPVEQRDINRIATLHDLEEVVRPFERETPVPTGAQQEKALSRKMHSPEHADIVANNERLKIVIPETFEAACYFGRNTKWCTTSDKATFAEYFEDGPLYIILDKKNNRRWQFHFPSDQFMDERDHDIELDKFLDYYPEVVGLIDEEEFYRSKGARINMGIRHMTDSMRKRLFQEPDAAARAITDARDLAHVPEEIYSDIGFMMAAAQSNVMVFEKCLPGMTDRQKDVLVARHPPALGLLPERDQIERRRLIAAKNATNLLAFRHIKRPWSEAITDCYWKLVLKRFPIPATLFKDAPSKYFDSDLLLTTIFKGNPRLIELRPDLMRTSVARSLIGSAQEFIRFIAKAVPDWEEMVGTEWLDQRRPGWRDEPYLN